MKILIVDDNESARMMIKIILKRSGHEVIGEASDADGAIKAFSELKPDVVLMDIIRPQRSGLEAINDILVIDPRAKIIAVTAMDQDEINIHLKKLVSAIIYKPFSFDDFERALKKIQADHK